MATYLEKGYLLKDCAEVVGISPGQLGRWWKKHKHKYVKSKIARASRAKRRLSAPAPPPDPTPPDTASDVELVLEEERNVLDLHAQPHEVREQMIREGLFLLSDGTLTPNEYAAISRELRYWREHEFKFGSLTKEKETVKLDPADTEYILSQVEEVFCSACPWHQNALATATREQEKKRILPGQSP